MNDIYDKEFFNKLMQFVNDYLDTTRNPTFIGFLEYKNKMNVE